MTLTTRWTKHLKTKRARDDFEVVLRNSTQVLSRLYELLDEDLESLETQELSPKSFEEPNWAEKQAYINGRKYQLKQTKALLEFING